MSSVNLLHYIPPVIHQRTSLALLLEYVSNWTLLLVVHCSHPLWVIIFHLDYCCSHLIDLHWYSGPYIIHSSLTSKVIFFVNIIWNLNKTFQQFPVVLGMFSQLITKAHRSFCMTLLPTSVWPHIMFFVPLNFYVHQL